MSLQQLADSAPSPRQSFEPAVDNVKLQRRITSRAADYAQGGNLDDAIETLELGLEQYPDNLYFLGQLGLLYRRAGYADDAKTCLERSFALKPNDIRTVTALAGVYVDLGLDGKAEDMLHKAQALDRNDKFVVVSLAKLLGDQGRYDEAAALLETTGGLEQGNKFVMSSYGIIQALRGEPHLARDVLERAYVLHSRDSHIVNLLGTLRGEMGDYAAAEHVLIAGMRNDSRNRHICASLATVFLRQKKYDDAERVLQTGLRANDSDIVLINMLGNAYAQQGQYERAEDTLLRAIRLDPGNLAVATTLGHTYLKAGEYARYTALIGVTNVALSATSDESYVYLLAKGAFLTRRKSDALAACRRLLELRGMDAQIAILYMACSDGADTKLGRFAKEFGVEGFADLNARAAEIARDPHLIDRYDPKFCKADATSAFVIEPKADRSNERRMVRAAALVITSLLVGATGLHVSGISHEALAAANFLGASPTMWMTMLMALCCCTPDVPQARRVLWAVRE